jgi:hypothetical protein
MGGMVLTALVAAGVGQAPVKQEIGSFLYQPAFKEDFVIHGPARPYQPEPGDIVFAADGSLFWLITHNLAGTSHPTHSAIVFRRPDGTMAILEGGPHDTRHVETMDALPHLRSYEEEGRVWIRRRAVPLTQEESDRLTEFAQKQDRKRFAIIRLGGQLTPLRARGPIKIYFMGKPDFEQRTYYCSELVMNAIVYAGLYDASIARPSATYPRDIFMERSLNPFLNKHLKLPCWDPPARWVSCVDECK